MSGPGQPPWIKERLAKATGPSLVAGRGMASIRCLRLARTSAARRSGRTWISKSGDLLILREHRLLCGDAGKPEDVDRLLDGATAS